jgi:hypothetical protein
MASCQMSATAASPLVPDVPCDPVGPGTSVVTANRPQAGIGAHVGAPAQGGGPHGEDIEVTIVHPNPDAGAKAVPPSRGSFGPSLLPTFYLMLCGSICPPPPRGADEKNDAKGGATKECDDWRSCFLDALKVELAKVEGLRVRVAVFNPYVEKYVGLTDYPDLQSTWEMQALDAVAAEGGGALAFWFGPRPSTMALVELTQSVCWYKCPILVGVAYAQPATLPSSGGGDPLSTEAGYGLVPALIPGAQTAAADPGVSVGQPSGAEPPYRYPHPQAIERALKIPNKAAIESTNDFETLVRCTAAAIATSIAARAGKAAIATPLPRLASADLAIPAPASAAASVPPVGSALAHPTPTFTTAPATAALPHTAVSHATPAASAASPALSSSFTTEPLTASPAQSEAQCSVHSFSAAAPPPSMGASALARRFWY